MVLRQRPCKENRVVTAPSFLRRVPRPPSRPVRGLGLRVTPHPPNSPTTVGSRDPPGPTPGYLPDPNRTSREFDKT